MNLLIINVMVYEERVLAFIDVLGFEKAVKKTITEIDNT